MRESNPQTPIYPVLANGKVSCKHINLKIFKARDWFKLPASKASCAAYYRGKKEWSDFNELRKSTNSLAAKFVEAVGKSNLNKRFQCVDIEALYLWFIDDDGYRRAVPLYTDQLDDVPAPVKVACEPPAPEEAPSGDAPEAPAESAAPGKEPAIDVAAPPESEIIARFLMGLDADEENIFFLPGGRVAFVTIEWRENARNLE
jgi:hypothetical protein